MLRIVLLTLLLLGLLVPLFTLASPPVSRSPVTVSRLSLKEYAGKWYEVARIPNRFQDKCMSDTQADYTLDSAGRVNIKNTCKTTTGKQVTANGQAWLPNPSHPGKLKVSFLNFFGHFQRWASGDYWVLGVRPMRYSVVGSPDRKWGWVLSRTPQLDDISRSEVLTVLKKNGYGLCQFVQDPPASNKPRKLAFCSP